MILALSWAMFLLAFAFKFDWPWLLIATAVCWLIAEYLYEKLKDRVEKCENRHKCLTLRIEKLEKEKKDER